MKINALSKGDMLKKINKKHIIRRKNNMNNINKIKEMFKFQYFEATRYGT